MTLYTKREASAVLKISERTLERLLASGDLRAYKVSGSVRISEQHIEDYLVSNMLQPEAKARPKAAKGKSGRRKAQPAPVYVPGMKVV